MTLPVESAYENGFAEDVSVHRIEDLHPNLVSVCALRRRLRNVQLCVECIQLERIVMIRTRTGARPHKARTTQTELTCSVRQFARFYTFRQTCGGRWDIPSDPMQDVRLGALLQHRFGIMHEQNKSLCSHRH